jgi:hypothetical protein
VVTFVDGLLVKNSLLDEIICVDSNVDKEAIFAGNID